MMAKQPKQPWSELKGKLALWLRAYLNEDDRKTFLNNTWSAKAAGYVCKDEKSFQSVGAQNFAKLKPLIESWMDSDGLTESSLKLKHKKLSNAQETKFITVKGDLDEESLPEGCTIICKARQTKSTGGEDASLFEEISTVMAVSVDALVIQQKMVDMGYRVKGMYNDKVEVTGLDKLTERLVQAHKRAGE